MAVAMDRRAATDYFWNKVDRSGGVHACHPWLGSIIKNTGYGQLHLKVFHPLRTPHKLAYFLTYGEIPEGMEIDHTCHNEDLSCPGGTDCPHRRCCNPLHLEAVPKAVNRARANKPRKRMEYKTTCSQGHEYTEANTQWNTMPNGRKTRACRACLRERSYEYRTGEKRPAEWGDNATKLRVGGRCRNGHQIESEADIRQEVAAKGRIKNVCAQCHRAQRDRQNERKRRLRAESASLN